MTEILIINSDIQIAYFMQSVLQSEGYKTETVNTGKDGLDKIENSYYSLILLDVNIPDLNGTLICAKIREKYNTPIIILSLKNILEEKIAYLDSGANDFIVKPVEIGEFLARVRANLRVYNIISNDKVIEYKMLKIIINTREVKLGKISIQLSPKEFDILLFLSENNNVTLTKQKIFEKIWKEKFEQNNDKRLVDEHIKNLRRKLHKNGMKLIHTVYGVGYIIK